MYIMHFFFHFLKRTFIVFLVICFMGFTFLQDFFVVHARAVSSLEAVFAAALVSYVGSAGVRLWREGVGSDGDDAVQQLTDDILTLWDDVYRDENFNRPTWEVVAHGISLDSGKFIFDYDSAQSMQAFTDWLGSHYNMIPDNTYSLTDNGSTSNVFYYELPSDEREGLSNLDNGYWAMPAIGMSPQLSFINSGNVQYDYSGGSFLVCIDGGSSSRAYTFVLVSETQFTVLETHDGNTSSLTPSLVTKNGVSRPNTSGNSFVFYRYIFSLNKSYNFLTPIFLNNTFGGNNGIVISEIAYVLLAGNRIGGTDDMFATVGKSIGNLVYDLLKPVFDAETDEVVTPGQSLSIDVGLDLDATEDDVIERVVGGYVGGERAIGGFESVATPVPIEGSQELYPQPATDDVDGLGLPALGQALTNVFPFCIPFDVVALVKSLNAEALPPHFEIDLVTDSMRSRLNMSSSTDTSFTLDLSDPKFEVLHKLIYWGTTLTFCLSLAFATKRLIWSSGG